jgi:hypothetical protein
MKRETRWEAHRINSESTKKRIVTAALGAAAALALLAGCAGNGAYGNNRTYYSGAPSYSRVSVPTVAWERIGSIEFSRDNVRETQYGNFGGSVEGLAFQARDSDVTCRDVTATYSIGQRQEVFRGSLQRGRVVAIDLPGRERFVRQLDFNCRSADRTVATVDISADVGRYQDEWRRSPDWDRMWSRVFNWDATGWVTLGSEQFSGRNDREVTYTGWQGRNLQEIALRPVNDDARCRNVTATFAGGERRNLNLDNGDMLLRDRITTMDLRGNRRDVTRIDMNCHAEHGGTVTIQVLASR